MYIFQWLTTLEKDLKKSDKVRQVPNNTHRIVISITSDTFAQETIKLSQQQLEKTLLKYLSSTSPKPTRPIRQLIARCFVIIYTLGDTRTLFDTLAATQAIVARKVEDSSVRM